MGIKHTFWAAMRRAGSLGHAERNRMQSRHGVSGPDLAKTRPEFFAAAGRNRTGPGEKITRAGYVIDEWDGTVVILSRLN